MKHKIGYNRLGRKSSHRKALHRNMVTSLFKHERITTTKAKAREIRRTAEKMITRAKVDSVHNRRTVGKKIKDEAVLAKLFKEIGPRYVSRPGGYTRMLKLGPRPTDASEMVILELVNDEAEAPEKGKRKKADKSEKKEPKAEKKKSTEEEEVKTEKASTEEPAPEAEDADASDEA